MLNEDNFSIYAAKHYDEKHIFSAEDFEEDLMRFKYIKRLCNKYNNTGILKERLILNHLIVLYNVFYKDACTNMIVFKLRNHLTVIKPFLVYLNYWDDNSVFYDNLLASNISLDNNVIEALRKI